MKKNKLSEEFETLYFKEVLKNVVKLWFEKDNFLNEDLKKINNRYKYSFKIYGAKKKDNY